MAPFRDNRVSAASGNCKKNVSGGGARDTIDKLNEYEQGGGAEYWILDPERQEARFYKLREGRYEEATLNGTVFESAVLKGFRLDVPPLWQKPLPSVRQTLDDLGLRGGRD